MGQFKEIKAAFMKIIKKDATSADDTIRKSKSSDDLVEEEQESMVTGESEQVYGVKRKIVFGCVSVIAVCFISAFVFNFTDSGKQSPVDKKINTSQTKIGQRNSIIPNVSYDNNQYKSNIGIHDQKAMEQKAMAEAQKKQAEELKKRQAELEKKAASQLPQLPPQPNVSKLPSMPSVNGVAGAIADVASNKNNISFNINSAFNNAVNTAQQVAGTASATVNSGTSFPSLDNGMNSAMALEPNMVGPGSIIPAILITGYSSDIDSAVLECQVNDNVYDTLTGTRLLIPAGTKLLGKPSVSGNGKEVGRVAVDFTMMIFPNGRVYQLKDSMVAIDGAGYSGIKGKVDRHTDRMLGAGAFGAGIAALGSMAAGNVNNDNNTYSAGQLAMQGAMANIINSTSQIFQKNSNTQTSVTVPAGYKFNIFVLLPLAF